MPSVARRSRIFGAILTLSSLVSCADPTTSSVECRSPDHAWIARAYTVVHGGFGTAGVETIVELRRTSNSGSPERVLAFANDGPAIKLRMQWDGPKHLAVVYDADPELLYYQVAKTYGIEISVKDIGDYRGAPPPISAQP